MKSPIKIPKELILRGTHRESQEHKWAPKWLAAKIALDHIREKGGRAYPKKSRR